MRVPPAVLQEQVCAAVLLRQAAGSVPLQAALQVGGGTGGLRALCETFFFRIACHISGVQPLHNECSIRRSLCLSMICLRSELSGLSLYRPQLDVFAMPTACSCFVEEFICQA